MTVPAADKAPMGVWGRIVRIAETDALLVMTLASFALILLVLTPALLVGDSWMTLVAGREVANGGLPREETLTVLGLGREWIDQQWGAQLVFYAAEALGGLRLVILANIVLIGGAYAIAAAAARHRGASVRSTLILTALAIVAAPWAWQVRAQAVALPLLAATLWLLVDGQRHPRRRTLIVLPLLVVWANTHGSVILGALLVMLAGGLDLVRRRGTPWRALALLTGAPLLVFASPYALDLPGYYNLMIIDPPFEGLIVEWRPTRPEWKTLVFFVLAGGATVLSVWQRRRLMLFELGALLLTFWVALDAIRSVIWFVLAALVILPQLLDGAFGVRDSDVLHRATNRIVSAGAVVAVVAGVVVTAAQPAHWFEDEWPTRALPVVRAATADPSTRVYPMARYADWLLWHQPELEGRMAYDVRFEIYPRREIEELADFASRNGDDWGADTDGYQLLVLDTNKVKPSEWRAGLRDRRVLHEQPGILVLEG